MQRCHERTRQAAEQACPHDPRTGYVLTGQRDRRRLVSPQHQVPSARRCWLRFRVLTGFKQPDPLLHRTFGAIVTATGGERLDDLRLRSPRGKSHQFSVFVLTRHPSTPEGWLADMDDTMRRVEAQGFAARRTAHERWWNEFWNRSWIRASAQHQCAVVRRVYRAHEQSFRAPWPGPGRRQ